MWVLDHLDDLESDFSVFHRVDDIYSLDGPRFFRLAYRIAAYPGVIQARLMNEEEQQRREGAPRVGEAGERTIEVPLSAMAGQHPDWLEVVSCG